MSVSLVVTTYNSKEALGLYLQTAIAQTRLPDEIVIADDGSRDDTRELVDRFRERSPVPLVHVWQEDQGFRAARVRNLAVASAKGEYIIYTDGDLLLDCRFIADHMKAATPGCFALGAHVLVGRRHSEELLRTGKTRIGLFSPGLARRYDAIRSRVLFHIRGKTRKRPLPRSCNMAVWRDDVIAVNGFNEVMVGWGYEDLEFVERLRNLGLTHIYLKHWAQVYHLYHSENSRDRAKMNMQIFEDTRRRGLKWCETGIDRFLEGAIRKNGQVRRVESAHHLSGPSEESVADIRRISQRP